MNRTWRQSTAKRSVSGTSFTQGVIDFDFSVGSNTVFIPSKSYFRIKVKLTGVAGAPPIASDDISFSNFCPGNLFDNAFFYAGGQNVSSCINYSPQAHALAYRLKKSGAWMNSIGKDAYGICASHKTRQLLALSGADVEAVEADQFASVPSVDASDASIRYMIYQPPLGIMEHSRGMGAGQYRFQFNPSSNYAFSGVESTTDKAVSTFGFEVQGMELYVCEERLDVNPTGTDTLHLLEHQVQSKKLSESQSLDFTVPHSTKAISVFMQASNAGTSTLYTPSVFKTNGNAYLKVENLQITYGNMTKPPTNIRSDTGTNTNGLQQRYLDTQIESGQAFSSGGTETFADWQLNGPIYHYTFAKDTNNRSTNVQLSLNHSGVDTNNNNIFLVAHYTRSIDIQVEQGFISQVTALNI
jgi:hypothetical protein